jgi:hypothetical protein
MTQTTIIWLEVSNFVTSLIVVKLAIFNKEWSQNWYRLGHTILIVHICAWRGESLCSHDGGFKHALKIDTMVFWCKSDHLPNGYFDKGLLCQMQVCGSTQNPSSDRWTTIGAILPFGPLAPISWCPSSRLQSHSCGPWCPSCYFVGYVKGP